MKKSYISVTSYIYIGWIPYFVPRSGSQVQSGKKGGDVRSEQVRGTPVAVSMHCGGWQNFSHKEGRFTTKISITEEAPGA